MFCHQCGSQISEEGNFCPHCGAPKVSPPSAETNQTQQSPEMQQVQQSPDTQQTQQNSDTQQTQAEPNMQQTQAEPNMQQTQAEPNMQQTQNYQPFQQGTVYQNYQPYGVNSSPSGTTNTFSIKKKKHVGIIIAVVIFLVVMVSVCFGAIAIGYRKAIDKTDSKPSSHTEKKDYDIWDFENNDDDWTKDDNNNDNNNSDNNSNDNDDWAWNDDNDWDSDSNESYWDDDWNEENNNDNPSNSNTTPTTPSTPSTSNTPDNSPSSNDSSPYGNSGLKIFNSLEEYVNSDIVQSVIDTFKNQLSGNGMDIAITAEGDTLVYTFTYSTLTKTEGMDEMMKAAVEAQDDTFQTSANQMKALVNLPTLYLEIRYVDANGELIFSKTYTAE